MQGGTDFGAGGLDQLAPIGRETVQDRIYRQLRDALTGGCFDAGEVFLAGDIAARMSVSSMPVREALARLVSERALEAMPNRRVRVPPLSLERARDIAAARSSDKGGNRGARCCAPEPCFSFCDLWSGRLSCFVALCRKSVDAGGPLCPRCRAVAQPADRPVSDPASSRYSGRAAQHGQPQSTRRTPTRHQPRVLYSGTGRAKVLARTGGGCMSDVFDLWDLRVEVVAPAGAKLWCGANVGDYFELRGEMLHLPAGQGISIYSLASVLPLLAAKQRMTHPNDWMRTDAEIACPDPNCPSRLRISRIGKRSFNHAETTAVALETPDNANI